MKPAGVQIHSAHLLLAENDAEDDLGLSIQDVRLPAHSTTYSMSHVVHRPKQTLALSYFSYWLLLCLLKSMQTILAISSSISLKSNTNSMLLVAILTKIF